MGNAKCQLTVKELTGNKLDPKASHESDETMGGG